ncbi:MAG: glycosyltransferase family 4 protein, partial [Calditrichaeota bacterium]
LGIVGKRLIPLFANYLRMWDASSSSRVDRFIANSGHVARRIKKFYGRESSVIHPPVETSVFSVSKTHNNYYLIVSALVPYKKVDLAIDAFNRMQKKLLIIGEGPEKSRLQKISGKTIEFIDWQPHDKLTAYYENCLALIFPGEEDFGIVPVEAMACGKPVVAYGRGGALETVIGKDDDPDKKSGIFFNDLNPESLIEAVEKCDRTEWDPDFIGEHARKFDIENFRSTVTEFISQELDDYYRKM